MIKIVHILTISDSLGFLDGLSSEMLCAGFELVIICSDSDKAVMWCKRNNAVFYPVNIFREVNLINDIRSLFMIMKALRLIKPDIVHSHTPKAGLLAMLASFLTGVRFRLFHLHGLKYTGEKGLKRIIVRRMEKLTLSLAYKVFSVSNSLKEFVNIEKLVSSEKITVLQKGSIKGINLNESRNILLKGKDFYRIKRGLDRGSFVFGFCGRITPEKGIDEIIIACNRLWDAGFLFELLICGKIDSEDKSFINRLNSFAKKKNVISLGYVEHPLEAIVCMDVLLLPTYREGFGLVNIEANSVGVPVITTNVIGCIDSIEKNQTGLLIEPKSVIELEEAMKKMITNPVLVLDMGKAGINRSHLFDRRLIWQSLVQEYKILLT